MLILGDEDEEETNSNIYFSPKGKAAFVPKWH